MRYDIDAPLTDESVTRAVTDLANQRLSPNRPLWAVHLVGDFAIRAIIPVNLRPVHSIEEMDDSMGNRFGRKASLVVTNLPGPREPLYIDGKRLQDVMFWVPHPARLGVGFSILSYAGKVIVGVRVDEAVTKYPGRFVELFEEEVSSMLEKANS
jgi:hypothetical protein